MNLDLLSPQERLEVLATYLEGALDDESSREVAAWLDRNPEALREIEHQRRLWDLLGRYADERVPAGFAQRVLDAAGARRGASPVPETSGLRLLRRPWAVAAAAAALVALGVGLQALRTRGQTAGPAPEALSVASIDLDLVQHANLEGLLTLSDAEFEALLAAEPDALADESLGG
jgi:anti-sigma factor RsiW